MTTISRSHETSSRRRSDSVSALTRPKPRWIFALQRWEASACGRLTEPYFESAVLRSRPKDSWLVSSVAYAVCVQRRGGRLAASASRIRQRTSAGDLHVVLRCTIAGTQHCRPPGRCEQPVPPHRPNDEGQHAVVPRRMNFWWPRTQSGPRSSVICIVA
eukprot:198499-Prymnesium_polylepis.1